MKTRWVFLLILMMTHSLFASAVAASHVSAEKHGQFEIPHIHIGKTLDSHSEFHDLPGHDWHIGDGLHVTLSGVDIQEDDHDHESIAHVHISCDHGTTPLDFHSDHVEESSDVISFYSDSYLGLHYKPAVPPPNA